MNHILQTFCLIRYISMSVADSMFLATISTSSISVSPGEAIIWDFVLFCLVDNVLEKRAQAKTHP